ncbi:MAG: hypothetical protein OXP69_03855 [Spirochaetaceae bacterium]|nr:hypothetical protein [Spirochaetaceae bacterium]
MARIDRILAPSLFAPKASVAGFLVEFDPARDELTQAAVEGKFEIIGDAPNRHPEGGTNVARRSQQSQCARSTVGRVEFAK